MRSPNKRAQTVLEAAHVSKVAQLDCVVCNEPGPSVVHEPEQGLWFASVALCPACHGGPGFPEGWHGTRLRLKLRKMTELKAINETLRRVAMID